MTTTVWPMKSVKGLSILCTGGTGTFGNAFAQRALEQGVKRFVVYSRDEVKQFQMSQEVRDDRMRFFLGDVRDLNRLEMAMRDIDVVVHAAALKRIEACERDPLEAVRTNIDGSANVIMATLRTGVRRAIGLSTDKAVDPINLYGSTKLCMERLFIAANNLSAGQCQFAICRYGNISGSRGSVIPIWRDQIARGQEITVTAADATRFWMTISEAVDLVIDSLDKMRGGEVFRPTLPAFRLGDLAEAMGATQIRNVDLPSWEKINETLGNGQTTDTARRMSVEEIRDKLGRIDCGKTGTAWG